MKIINSAKKERKNNFNDKNMGKRILKSAALGTVLGAGLVWLNKTKQGRKMKDKIISEVERAARAGVSKLPNKGSINPKKIESAINKISYEYAKNKSLASAFKNFLKTEMKKRGNRT